MRPIDPAEISALFDGELPPERAQEVRFAIAEDASLRDTCQQLAALDTALKAAAVKAMFQPQVILPAPESGYGVRVFFAAMILVILRLAMKLSPPQWATLLSIVLLAIVIGWLLQRLLQISEEKCLLVGAGGWVAAVDRLL